jgi:hypothetical protein
VNTRTLLAGATILGAGLVTPLVLRTQAPTYVDPGVRVHAVTVRNDCPRSVWIFYGRHPPLRTQDMFSIGPHMQEVRSMLPGDMVWLLDGHARELDRIVFEVGMEAIRVLPSCTRLGPSMP